MPGHESNQDVNISGARGGGTPTDEAPGAEDRSFQTKPGDTEPAGPGGEENGYPFDPSTAEVNRSRLGGVGQKEMDAQRDPDRGFEPAAPVATEAEMSQTPDPERTDRAQHLGGSAEGNS